MHKVTLANGDELLIVQKHEGMLFIHLYGVAVTLGQPDESVVNIDLADKKHIGTLTVHEDRSATYDFCAKNEWVSKKPLTETEANDLFYALLQSQLPLVNPYIKPNMRKPNGGIDFTKATEFKRWQEAESKRMKPGKYIVILKQKP